MNNKHPAYVPIYTVGIVPSSKQRMWRKTHRSELKMEEKEVSDGVWQQSKGICLLVAFAQLTLEIFADYMNVGRMQLVTVHYLFLSVVCCCIDTDTDRSTTFS